MFTRPASVSDATIVRAVADHWRLTIDRAEYAPVGFGSHHWLAGTTGTWKLFVTVDDLLAKAHSPHEALERPFERLDAAFTTARDLADAWHHFVVAPRRARDGKVLHRLDERYTVACFPYLDVRAGEFGQYRSDHDRDEAAHHLVVLHELNPVIAPSCRVESFELPNREELMNALDQLEVPWDGGPHAESARELLRKNADAVLRLLGRFDASASEALETRTEWRLTHGEPHGSNVVATGNEIRLIDWDTALVAPRERDAWHLDPDNTTAAMLYKEAGGQEIDDRLLDLYRVHWDLSEIAGYVSLFRFDHEDTEDARESLRNLAHYAEHERS